MPDQPDQTKQVLEETLRQLFTRAVSQKGTGNNYLQAGDGQFLGKITDNQYDRDSILNPYGPYGSIYSPTSIHNQYSKYGSPYSTLSLNSFYAANHPILFLGGNRRGVVTKNRFQQNRIDTEVFLHLLNHDLGALLHGQIPDHIPPTTTARAYLQAADGTFLGSLTRNPYAEDSIFNKFGPYGNQFSPTSIFNQFSNYGGQFSALSPYNSFTSTPPVIILNDRQVAYLTKNMYLAGEKVDSDQLTEWVNQNIFF